MDSKTDKNSGNAGGNKEPAKKPNKSNAEKQANRILCITVALTLVVMAVIVTVTSIANRARPKETSATSAEYPGPTTAFTTAPPEITTETEEVIAPQTDEPVIPTEDKLPEFSLPVKGTLTKEHDLTRLVFSVTMRDWRVHKGVDIACEKGSAVGAAADGIIKEISDDPMMGMCIYVEHNGGAMSVYKNLSNVLGEGIEAGVKVKAGQTIGYTGETAIIEIGDAPHLHFELEIDGQAVNPLDYFSAATMSSLQEQAFEG